MTEGKPQVIIIGGGLAGLAAACELADTESSSLSGDPPWAGALALSPTLRGRAK